MQALKNILTNAITFAIIYIILMIGTYLLPYLGSNSSINAVGSSIGEGVSPAFWVHLIILLLLVVITWIRGVVINKQWLVIFPILALVFDMIPGLNFIPFIPTIMHLFAIIKGVSEEKV